jgi:dTMP kinase
MKLFVIEGLDGSGKSTQIKLLTEYFVEKGYSCEYLHFPRTESPYFGELIARFLRGEFGTLENVDPYLVAMLYAGDRKDASEMISKWMKDGKMVILDRYTYSNIAYQCAKITDADKKKELMSWIFALEFEHFAIPRPDLNIFLDVPFAFTEKKLTSVRSGDDRAYLNGTADIHESSLDFQKKVRDIYLEVADLDDRLEVVNCNNRINNSILAPQEIFKMIVNLINSRKLI